MQERATLRGAGKMTRELSVISAVFLVYPALNGLYNWVRAGLIADAGREWTDIALRRLAMARYLAQYMFIFTAMLCLFFILRRREPAEEYFKIRRAPRPVFVLAGAFGVLGANYLFNIIARAGGVSAMASSVETLLSFSGDPVCDLLYILSIGVVPPILEEFCFRGVICGRLARYNRPVAVVVSALAFSLMHMTVGQIPLAFCAGLIMGHIYLETESLWTTVIIHAVNNNFALWLEWEDQYGGVAGQRLGDIAFAATFVLGLIGVCWLILRKREKKTPVLSTRAAALSVLGCAPYTVCCLLFVIATALSEVFV